jgi:hypothetical protein
MTAENGGGSSSPASSALSGQVKPPPTPAAPNNISPPTIVGTPLPGNTLTCEPGTWTGNPTTYDYQWNQDTSNIPDATHQQYQVQISKEGHSLGGGVTAGNGGGSSSASASGPVVCGGEGDAYVSEAEWSYRWACGGAAQPGDDAGEGSGCA